MKKVKQMLVWVIIILPTILLAQTEVNIAEGIRPFTLGEKNSYQLDIARAKLKGVEKDWMSYLKTGAKGKAQSLNGEVIMLGAVNTNISLYPLNVYSKLLETTEGVRLTAWLALNDTDYISSTTFADKDLAVRKYLRDFAITQLRNVAEADLDAEKSNLKTLDNEMNSIIKDIEKCNKKIAENNRTIERNRDEIRTNELEQTNKDRQILSQKQTVDNTRQAYGATNKAAIQALKDLEKEKTKLQKDKEKLSKGIDDANADTRAQERSIEKLNSDKQSKQRQIDEQSAKVKAAEDKLANIK